MNEAFFIIVGYLLGSTFALIVLWLGYFARKVVGAWPARRRMRHLRRKITPVTRDPAIMDGMTRYVEAMPKMRDYLGEKEAGE